MRLLSIEDTLLILDRPAAGRPTRRSEDDTSRWWKRSELVEASRSSFQACTNLVNVSATPFIPKHSKKADRELTRCTLRSELNLLTGVAAILTYPLDVEVVEMEEREEEERLKLEKEAETAAQAAQ